MAMRPTDSSDWIVAPATGSGPSAIAVVRLDGPGCWDAAARVWMAGNGSNDPPPDRRMVLGCLHDEKGAAIDSVLLVRFRGPHSYTGNDLVEFHCHGSAAVVRDLVSALQAAGARLARPGEFTERAFFNGRMDLAQAEGVANLIAAQTRAAGRAALAQIEGDLSRALCAIRERLLDVGAEIEAGLDFPEEDISTGTRQHLAREMAESHEELERLLATAQRGRLYRDGARVVLAGKPNTGKSSLLNALVGLERALVTPHPGTTRDTIEAMIDLRGIPTVLVDTAGVRGAEAGEIERLGIERTVREIERADLVLFVLDGSASPDAEDRRLFDVLGARPHVLVLNKSDLPAAFGDERLEDVFSVESGAAGRRGFVRVSALRRETLSALEDAVEGFLLRGEPDFSHEGPMVINLRHAEQLRRASDALARAREAFGAGASGELAMVDLAEALDALGGILGLSLDGAILTRIFERFCIGK